MRERGRTKGDPEVAEGAAGDGHVDGELGVAERRQEGADPRNGVGNDDGGAGVLAGGAAGGHKHPGTDHPAKPQPHEVRPPQRPRHVRTGPRTHTAHLLVRRRHRSRPPSQPSGSLCQCPSVRPKTRERRRRRRRRRARWFPHRSCFSFSL